VAASAGLTVARRFGANLRAVRQGAGLSQEAVGFAAELHRTEVGLLERGARVPRIDTLLKLSTALGVSADTLLAGITFKPGKVEVEPGQFTTGGES
jgi:transcriptional regulator with XRE-family HTH domain